MPLKAYFGSLRVEAAQRNGLAQHPRHGEPARHDAGRRALATQPHLGEHDLGPREPQAAGSVFRHIEKSYGGAKNVEEFVELAQFLDYEIYRAMFESQSRYRMEC